MVYVDFEANQITKEKHKVTTQYLLWNKYEFKSSEVLISFSTSLWKSGNYPFGNIVYS